MRDSSDGAFKYLTLFTFVVIIKERAQEATMKKLLTLLLLTLTFPLFCSSSVNIQIKGNISKFITISSSESAAILDLDSDYDRDTGHLNSADHTLSLIDVRANVRDGYTVKASSVNNFKLRADSHASIGYSLRLQGAVDTPQGATFSVAENNNDLLLNTTGSFSFTGNKLTDAELTLQTESESDFTLEDEEFSDTVTLTVTAN